MVIGLEAQQFDDLCHAEKEFRICSRFLFYILRDYQEIGIEESLASVEYTRERIENFKIDECDNSDLFLVIIWASYLI